MLTRSSVATFSPDIATREMQDIYREPVEAGADRQASRRSRPTAWSLHRDAAEGRTHYETALEAG
jgi:hypothetical protein